MEKPTSILKSPKFDMNPFIEGAIREIEEKTVIKQRFGNRTDQKGIVSAVDPQTGEIFQTSFLRRVEIDEEQFTKMYISNLAVLNSLSTAGIRVLSYIMSELKPNHAEIIFNKERCMTSCKYKSLKPIYKGLAELINADIIARGWADNIYFINPLVFFNGNRVVFATEYIKKRNPDIKSRTLSGAIKAVTSKTTPDYPTMDEALFPDGINPVE